MITVGNLFEGVEFHKVLVDLDACEVALNFQGDKCIIDTIEAMQKFEAIQDDPLIDLGKFWAWAVWLASRLATRFSRREEPSYFLMYQVCEDVLTLERTRIRIVDGLHYAIDGLDSIPSERIQSSANLYDTIADINRNVYSEGLAQVLKALKEVVLPAHRAEQGE